MLRFLSIQNLAVIESLEVEFEAGLNVLTGETGAGKSMLVGAVGLLVGGRASPDLVRTGAGTAVVQAEFDGADGQDLVIRREVTAQGRSRAFVNGVLVTTAALKEAGAALVDLHGQHEHQALLDPASHVDLLDQYGELSDLRGRVDAAWHQMRAASDALHDARRQQRERSARLDLVTFQLDEITRAAPSGGEDEELTTVGRVLASAEKIRRLCDESYGLLYDDDHAVVGRLSQIWKRVGELADLEPRFRPFLEARAPIVSQLDELARLLRDYGAGIDASPARLQQIEDRLAVLERLKRKYGPTLAEVLERQRALATERRDLETLDDRIEDLAAASAAAAAAYLAVAGALSAARRDTAARFVSNLERQLAELAMAGTRVEVRFKDSSGSAEQGSPRGVDDVEFYASPNPGEDLRPLARIVSGGELSRVMLALKTLASTDRTGKTLIFDEIDVGIGGKVAGVVGSRLRRLGERFQVLCITHLPQIAACAGAHFSIEKHVHRARTVTTLARLVGETRVHEIARMIGGSGDLAGAVAGARELLAASDPGDEEKAKGKGERAKAKPRRHAAATTG